jgi:acyl dehydratase
MAEKIPVGFEGRHTFKFTQQDVQVFADLTGDHNPIHLDAEYAATTAFKKPIIHGHLSSSVFTKYLGMEKPGGPGSIYMKQITEYLRPMFVDREYEVRFRVIEVNERRSTAEVATEIYDLETGKITIRGVGSLMNKENY